MIVKDDDPDSYRAGKDQVVEIDAEIVWEGPVVLAGFHSQSGTQDDIGTEQSHDREVDGKAGQSLDFKLS